MRWILIIVMVIVLFSCRKEEVITPENPITEESPSPTPPPPDTIFPCSYYPVYPGSYWTYQLNDGSLQTDVTSTDYLLDDYIMAWSSPSTTSDPVYVPFLNNKPIYGYKKPVQSWSHPPGHQFLHPIISEIVGFEYFRYPSDPRYGDFREYLTIDSKGINLDGDSVITVKGYYVYGPNLDIRTIEYYVKDVGLTAHYSYNYITGDTVYSKVLINYFINH